MDVGSFYNDSNVLLTFDYSGKRYSSPLIPTAKEYLRSEEWMPSTAFYEEGVIYTRKEHIEEVKEGHLYQGDSMREVREFPHPRKRIKKIKNKKRYLYPNADYLCILTYQDSSIYIPIIIPEQIKSHDIMKSAFFFYRKKIITPVECGNGMTGIYILNRIRSFSFCLYGFDLTSEEQAYALRAFESMKFK